MLRIRVLATLAFAAIAVALLGHAISLLACEFEDSQNCYWNAATMGNGTGSSFVDIGGTAYYWREGE